MEKRTCHYDLVLVKRLVKDRQFRITNVALAGAAALKMDESDMLAVVANLTLRCFCKSVTSHADHRIWQDVYHPQTASGAVYLKLTVIEHLLILSFKER